MHFFHLDTYADTYCVLFWRGATPMYLPEHAFHQKDEPLLRYWARSSLDGFPPFFPYLFPLCLHL